MARAFTTNEAKDLVAQHKSIQDGLDNFDNMVASCQLQITDASNALLSREAYKQLRKIPIEEINRDKRGFRVKALHDHGYHTIADISGASVANIAAIRGVGQDSAEAIYNVVRNIVNQTLKGTKIKLSLDDQNSDATKLVIPISRLHKSQPYIEEEKKLKSYYEENIKTAITDIKPGTSQVRWLFTSSTKKEAADKAFVYLSDTISGDYKYNAEDIINSVDKIEDIQAREAWEDFSEDSIRFFNILEDICPGVLGNDNSSYGLPEDLAREIQDECLFPDGLLCQLRRYQEWGVKYILHQGRVLLGDEMGLGKTIQAIAAMVSLRNTGATHFVVVCPASVISNWCREIRKQSLLSVTKVHGSEKSTALASWKRTGGVAVTTYETTGSFWLDPSFEFSLLVVDEAHYIKNPNAARTVHVKELAEHAERLLFMTGTALENKVDEMLSLIKILNPVVAAQAGRVAFLSSAPQFREIIAGVYYRRKREDVLTELPEMIESQEWCSLNGEEEQRYEQAVLGKHYADARRVSWNIDNIQNSSKAKRLMEIVEEAKNENRKIIVFSFFLDTIHKICLLLGNRCTEPINGSVSPSRRQKIIDEFDSAPAGTVLPAQIQAGGTGLNIQSASVVILCEPQFKPSIENQAISRAYRMGQTRNVLVYRLLCENTIEEKIITLLEEKQRAFNAFADKSVAASESIELDDKTFGDIIQEEIDRINRKNEKASA